MVAMMSKFRILLFKMMFRKEENAMILFFTYMVIDEKITFADVPKGLKAKVKAKLIELDCGDYVTE